MENVCFTTDDIKKIINPEKSFEFQLIDELNKIKLLTEKEIARLENVKEDNGNVKKLYFYFTTDIAQLVDYYTENLNKILNEESNSQSEEKEKS
jgi:hypothetical protein